LYNILKGMFQWKFRRVCLWRVLYGRFCENCEN